jgi:hypothetical protein
MYLGGIWDVWEASRTHLVNIWKASGAHLGSICLNEFLGLISYCRNTCDGLVGDKQTNTQTSKRSKCNTLKTKEVTGLHVTG